MKWFNAKDKVVKLNKRTGLIEKQWKGSKLNKIYTVHPRINDTVSLYDVKDVLFNDQGEVIKAPSLHVSSWGESKIVHVEEVINNE